MRTILKSILKTERLDFEVILAYSLKPFYHKLILSQHIDSKILFVVGCQRSGTSLMNRIFTRDWNVKVYRESSPLSSADKEEKLRLNPLPEIEKTFAQDNAPLIVVKPLVETQNIFRLLNYFPNSKAIWMYRHYKDVINSSLQRFDINVGIKDIKYIVDNQQNWRSENVSDYTRLIVSEHFSEHMNPYDAAALFWLARNQLFYDFNLDKNPRVFMCRYKHIVEKPSLMIKQIYQFVGIKYSNSNLVKEVNNQSVGKGNSIQLSPSIERLCDRLLEKLTISDQNQIIVDQK